jgi:alkylation response protein AidB-like acyl-CoA dehydrogenase
VIGAPPDAPTLFDAGVQVLLRAAEDLDAVVLFVTERRVLERKLPELRRRLADTGMLWVAWPKKASGVQTDVTEDTIRDFAVAETDLVDVKVIAIDETWSGLKLMVRRSARSSKR